MIRQPNHRNAVRVFVSVLLWVFLVSPLACERSQPPAAPPAPPAPEAEPPQPLHWTDVKFQVFKGIPARVHFSLEGGDAAVERAATIETEIRRLLDGVDATFNAFKPETEVGRFNAATATEPVAVSEDFAKAVEIAHGVWQQSDGGFDLTIWPLKMLWNAAKERNRPPSDEELAETLATVGMDKLDFDAATRNLGRKVEGVSLDFGGIIKGYAVDRLCDMLREMGVGNALVQVGGEIRVFGQNPEGKPWVLGIQHPVKMETLFGALNIPKEYAVSSSGNYRQPLTIRGKAYYHIYDPKSGQPVPTRILGVTVVIKDGDYPNARADAWATALVTAGVEKGLELAHKNGFWALFLLESEQDKSRVELVTNEELKPFLVLP